MRNKYYMKEYQHFNGDYNVIFNLIEVNTDNDTVTVIVNNLGKITQRTFELKEENGWLYFEYGVMNEQIFIDDFVRIGGDAA